MKHERFLQRSHIPSKFKGNGKFKTIHYRLVPRELVSGKKPKGPTKTAKLASIAYFKTHKNLVFRSLRK